MYLERISIGHDLVLRLLDAHQALLVPVSFRVGLGAEGCRLERLPLRQLELSGPGIVLRLHFGRDGLDLLVQLFDAGLVLFALLQLFAGEQFDYRRFVASVGVLRLVEDIEDFEVLVLCQWIILVRMALRTAERQSHPYRHRGVDAVDDGDIAELFVVGTTFIVGQRVAMEGRRNQVVFGGIGQQVASDLSDRELVHGHIGIDSANDPVAITPNRAWRIIGIAAESA